MRTAVDVSYSKCVLSAYFQRLDPSYNKLHSPVAALLYRYCRIKPLLLIQVVPKRHDVDSMSSHIRLGLANSICRLLRNCSLACANSANIGTFQEPISRTNFFKQKKIFSKDIHDADEYREEKSVFSLLLDTKNVRFSQRKKKLK